MHVIAQFAIILLIFLRIIGLLIAIEFFSDLKERKFKILIIGWSIWIIAGCTALILGILENQQLYDIFRLINGITTSVSLLFVMMGLYTYFRDMSRKTLVILSIIFTSVPTITFLLGFFSIAFNLTSPFIFFIIVGYSFVTIKERKIFKNKISVKSFYWYIIVLLSFYIYFVSFVVFLLQGYSFGFYSDDFSIPMFVNYFLGTISTIALIIYSIQLEYDISKIQKFKLMDKYSHDLGNLIQVIYSAANLTNVNEDLDNEKAENINLIQKKCEDAAKLIKDIRKNQ